MAASGINEHNEGCRKQHNINQRSYHKWMFMNKNEDNKCDKGPRHLKDGFRSGVSHEQESNQRQRLCTKHGVNDLSAKQQQYVTYSAKINGRFTSVNYCQQW